MSKMSTTLGQGLPQKDGRGVSVNIKNTKTTQMIRELAALKEVTLVEAVTQAVQEKLDKERAEREAVAKPKKSRYELLMEFADQYSKGVENPIHSWDVDALLYDEHGLPK